MGFINFKDVQNETSSFYNGGAWGVSTPSTDMYGTAAYMSKADNYDSLLRIIDDSKAVYATKLDSDKEVRYLIDQLRVQHKESKMSKEQFLDRIAKIYSQMARDLMANAIQNQDKEAIDTVCKELTSRFNELGASSQFVEFGKEHSLDAIVNKFKIYVYENSGEIPKKFNKFKGLWDMFKTLDEKFLSIEPTTVFDALRRTLQR